MITAPLLVAWGFDDKTRGFWFWLLLTALFLVIARGLMTRVIRVFVCMDSGRFPVATIEANNFVWKGVEVEEAERRARKLAEAIRANMPDRA